MYAAHAYDATDAIINALNTIYAEDGIDHAA